jgi:hypothetical protein
MLTTCPTVVTYKRRVLEYGGRIRGARSRAELPALLLDRRASMARLSVPAYIAGSGDRLGGEETVLPLSSTRPSAVYSAYN